MATVHIYIPGKQHGKEHKNFIAQVEESAKERKLESHSETIRALVREDNPFFKQK